MTKNHKKNILKEIRATQFLLVHFSKENSWTIIKNDKGLFKEKDQKIVVHDPENDKWVTGKIKMIGTEEQCKENGERRYEKGEFFSSDNEARKVEMSPERLNSNKSKNAASKIDAENKKLNDLIAFYDNDSEDISSNQVTKSEIIIQRKNSVESSKQDDKPLSPKAQPFTTQDWIVNNEINPTNVDLVNSRDIKILLDTLIQKVDSLSTELSFCKDVLKRISSKKGYDKDWPTVLEYKKHNLLDFPSDKNSRYVRAVMAVLFTLEELGKGIIIDENNTTCKSSRKKLDPVRVKLLKEAYEIKYRIKDDQKKATWETVIELGNSYCRDCTKKLKNKNKNVPNDSQSSASSSQSSTVSKKSKSSETTKKVNKSNRNNDSISSVTSSKSSSSVASSSSSTTSGSSQSSNNSIHSSPIAVTSKSKSSKNSKKYKK